MALLFIDSTYDLTIGLLDDDRRWLSLESFPGQKGSLVLQREAHNLCSKHNIKPRELKAIISVAGPGFYTGLRLSEGFADIFKMFGIPHFAFYSYEIPRWLGVTQGSWLTKAYRGEYFFHRWNEEKNWNELISAKALPQKLQGMSSLYIHSLAAIDDPIKSAGKELKLTYDLLQTHSQDIFRHVQNEKLLRESFYFRAPEDEFRVAE